MQQDFFTSAPRMKTMLKQTIKAEQENSL